MSGASANVFSIPAGAPFLPTLAGALCDGTLPGAPVDDLLSLADTTIYLPTRRAARALGPALRAVMGRNGVLLPRIAALGEAGDEEIDAFATGEAIGLAAVSPLERRVVLADIARQWARTTHSFERRSPDIGPEPIPRTPAEAAAFAADLEQLLDSMATEGIGPDALERVVPDDLSHLAHNWEINLDFLGHAIRRWRSHLDHRGLVDPVTRRDRSLLDAATRLEREGSVTPVIAAGSTGSVPATAALLKAIATLPNGAVILPGLDIDLDDESWDVLPADHPQYGLKVLLDRIDIGRDEVTTLGPVAADNHAVRHRIVSEAMRPAPTADRWVANLVDHDPTEVAAALASVSLVEAADEHEEARVVALILREAAERPDTTAALVTPDRTLARRVRTELARWQLAVDDSAGRPLAKSVPAVLLRLIAQTVDEDFAALPLLELLKHPLTRLGHEAAGVRHAARVTELAALRGNGSGGSPADIVRALEATGSGSVRHPVVRRLTDDDRKAAKEMLERLDQALAPLVAAYRSAPEVAPLTLAQALLTAAEAVAATPRGGMPLWSGEDGEALALFAAELVAAAEHAAPMAPRAFRPWLVELMQGRVVRRPSDAGARVMIWGPLEARLQSVDRLVLGGLNEETWPAQTSTDPWLGRNMREALGLEPPERRLGQQAHDFTQSVLAPDVIMTRAAKSGGTPTVPSRWLWRLNALLDGLEIGAALHTDRPWIAWARALDAVDDVRPCPPPRPAPPVKARPQSLSVTTVETLIRDPYAVFARRILDLEPIPDLSPDPDAADYGLIIHSALGDLIDGLPAAPLPGDAGHRLRQLGERAFTALARHPGIRSYWWTRFERIARWYLEHDAEMRAPGTRSFAEIPGRMDIDITGTDGAFTLTARADRIDIDPDGHGAVVDYKTGQPPGHREIAAMLAPQLPLEAAMLRAGAFADVGAHPVSSLAHVALTGRDPPGAIRRIEGDPDDLADEALSRLTALIALYGDPATPYLSRRAPKRADIVGPYDHLARVGEWSMALGRSHVG